MTRLLGPGHRTQPRSTCPDTREFFHVVSRRRIRSLRQLHGGCLRAVSTAAGNEVKGLSPEPAVALISRPSAVKRRDAVHAPRSHQTSGHHRETRPRNAAHLRCAGGSEPAPRSRKALAPVEVDAQAHEVADLARRVRLSGASKQTPPPLKFTTVTGVSTIPRWSSNDAPLNHSARLEVEGRSADQCLFTADPVPAAPLHLSVVAWLGDEATRRSETPSRLWLPAAPPHGMKRRRSFFPTAT